MVRFPARAGNVILTDISRPTLRYIEYYFPGIDWPGSEDHHQLESRLKMHGAIHQIVFN
jgi:hypothetical protein